MTDYEKLQLVKKILKDTMSDDDYDTYDRGLNDALTVIDFEGTEDYDN